MVDLVDFGILSERRLENLNICMSQNMVDLVDFVFHSQRRLEISNICMSQNVVDLVDFVFSLYRNIFMIENTAFMQCSGIGALFRC